MLVFMFIYGSLYDYVEHIFTFLNNINFANVIQISSVCYFSVLLYGTSTLNFFLVIFHWRKVGVDLATTHETEKVTANNSSVGLLNKLYEGSTGMILH